MNIFDNIQSEDFLTFTDDPKGNRVILECERCRSEVYSAKYHVPTKLLSWKCSCGHISKKEDFIV